MNITFQLIKKSLIFWYSCLRRSKFRSLLIAFHCLNNSLTWDRKRLETLNTAMHAVDQLLLQWQRKTELWQHCWRRCLVAQLLLSSEASASRFSTARSWRGFYGTDTWRKTIFTCYLCLIFYQLSEPTIQTTLKDGSLAA